jgi:hypothetical protein
MRNSSIVEMVPEGIFNSTSEKAEFWENCVFFSVLGP